MPKISYSLAIASGIHILIFALGPMFSVDSNDSIGSSGQKNMISLNFESGSKPPTVAISKESTSAETIRTSSDVVSGGNGSSEESSNGGGDGDGSGKFSFEESALNFEGPAYPKIAIKRALQGIVRIRVKVSPEGLPENTDMLKSSGHEILDKAALDSAIQWKFQKRGTPYFVEKNIVFELRD